MPFVPLFSISQAKGLPSIIQIEDTSTGSDAAIFTRRVYLQTATNDYLVESSNTTADYTAWLISSGNDISIDCLDQDYCLNITIQWLNEDGDILYSKSGLYIFTMYNEEYYYQLTQNQVSAPNIVNDTNYYNNKGILRTLLDSANQACEFGGDIYSAQNCLDIATNMTENGNDYF